MRKKSRANKLFLCETVLSQALKPILSEEIHADCIVVWVKSGITVINAETKIGFRPPESDPIRTAVLVYEGIPIDADALTGWRTHLLQKAKCEVRCLFLTGQETTEEATALFKQKTANLSGTIPKPEATAVRLGDWVKAPEQRQGNALLMTMFFDSLGELLTRMDGIKGRFRDIVNMESFHSADFTRRLNDILKGKDADVETLVNALNEPFGAIRPERERIPRVLLLGETGVGKTLFANHLGDSDSPVTRISVAEFIGHEDMLEYALFGYTRGAYTSAREEGDPGLLLSNIGRVLFLDEIGTATPSIQAKLLAYLDDFMVRPRGATYSIFCPVLIVAATNANVLDNKDDYRKDLFQRFTDIHPIPPLRKLKHNFRYLIDVLLQNPAINTDTKKPVQEVGEHAFNLLVGRDYTTGNFRELSNLLREACRRATASGRNYLVKDDIPMEQANGMAETSELAGGQASQDKNNFTPP